MKYTHMFQWNIPADNELLGRSDRYINVIAEWDGRTVYGISKIPFVTMAPVNITFYECCWVLNWDLAHSQIEKIAQEHFADLARQERINRAKAELDMLMPAAVDNPVLDRYESNVNPVFTGILNSFNKAI